MKNREKLRRENVARLLIAIVLLWASMAAQAAQNDSTATDTTVTHTEKLTLRLDTTSYSADVSDSTFSCPPLPADYTGRPAYASSDTAVATIDTTGVVRLRAAGTTLITISCPEDSLYQAAQLQFTLTVTRTVVTRLNLRLDTTAFEVTLAQRLFGGPSLPSGYTGRPAYASSDTTVATVDASTGVVTLAQTGVTTITIACPADSLYNADTLAYQLTVLPDAGTELTADARITFEEDDYYDFPVIFQVTNPAGRTARLGNGRNSCVEGDIEGTLIVPDSVKINGIAFAVTAVAPRALDGCLYLGGVELPAGIDTIGAQAFRNCRNLTTARVPATVRAIGDRAFSYCVTLKQLTLAGVDALGNDAFGGCGQLRYLDLRQASLAVQEVNRDAGPFAGLGDGTLIYLPQGNTQATGLNVINTDSTGTTSSLKIAVNGTAVSPADCLKGRATYLLNHRYGEQVFGQRLGTDNCPVPSTQERLAVCRVQFFNGTTLRVTRYVNHADTVALPTAQEMGVNASQMIFKYSKGGTLTLLEAGDSIVSDLDVYAYGQMLAGEDGHVLQGTVTVTPAGGQAAQQPATYSVTSYRDRTVQLGDGTYAALATSVAGQVTLPDSVPVAVSVTDSTLIDSTLTLTTRTDTVPFAVTGVGRNALSGCAKVTDLDLPQSLTAIGAKAMAGTAALTHLVLPPHVTALGDSVLLNAKALRYLDLRQAQGLDSLPTSRTAGPLAGLASNAMVYLPVGLADTTGVNTITTDTAGVTACRQMQVNGVALDSTQCRAGAGTYLLNTLYGTQVFGQLIGTEACPVPSTDSTLSVLRVNYINGHTVTLSQYVNLARTVALPSPAEVGIATSGVAFEYLVDGVETPFTDSTQVLTDLEVHVYNLAQPGEDGYVTRATLPLQHASGAVTALPATVTILSYGQRTASLGDGRHTAIDTLSAGLLLKADSVVIDSTAYRLIRLENAALQGCKRLTGVELPLNLTAVGEQALAGCEALRTLSLPRGVTAVGDRAFEGDNALLYIDMRAATGLAVPAGDLDDGLLKGVASATLVYLPQGAQNKGTNLITTDSAGVTACQSLKVEGYAIAADDCRAGEATFKLNRDCGEQVFGQRLGTDNYPLPSTDSTLSVKRVRLMVRNLVRRNCYANLGQPLPQLPTPAELGMTVKAGEQVTYQVMTTRPVTTLTAATPINSDMVVLLQKQIHQSDTTRQQMGDVNGDGTLNANDVSAAVSHILGTAAESTFADALADVNGDSIVNANDVTLMANAVLGIDSLATDTLVTDSLVRPLLLEPPIEGTPGSKVTQLRVLVLGNSYSNDAYSYVPLLMRQLDPKVQLVLWILDASASTLQTHWNTYVQGGATYPYARRSTMSIRWYNGYTGTYTKPDGTQAYEDNSCSLKKALANVQFDLVLLQQGSRHSRDYGKYQPYLDDLINYLQANTRKQLKFGWLHTPAYADGYMGLESLSPHRGDGHNTSNDMCNEIIDCDLQVLNHTDVELVLPAGLAIQNARTTSLDNVTPHHMSLEYVHLTDGLPCLTEAYAVTQSLLNYLDRGRSIEPDAFNYDRKYLQSIGVPEMSNDVVGLTPYNRALAKQCVYEAIEHPFELTNCAAKEAALKASMEGENQQR